MGAPLSFALIDLPLQILTDQFLKQLIAFMPTNEVPGTLMACDIRRIAREQIANDLVDRAVALLFKRGVHLSQHFARIPLLGAVPPVYGLIVYLGHLNTALHTRCFRGHNLWVNGILSGGERILSCRYEIEGE
jgi:hypothetical protein